MNEKKLYITIDTEMDANIHWKKAWPPEYTSIYEGIPTFFRPLWNKYNVHPIYFLSPEIMIDERCCEIFRKEIEQGAVIGLHLHPEYIEPEMAYEVGRQTKASQIPCYSCSYEVEKAKIANLINQIRDKLGVNPEWYRAARFGADEDTYKILDELGVKYDSSVTPGINWSDRGGIDYRNFPQLSYNIQGTGLTEYPVTIRGKRFGVIGKILPDNWLFYKWLRPSHMTYVEMKSLVRKEYQKENSNLVMMFHSMEPMINKTPYVRNKLMQRYFLWRLDKIINYAYKNNYIM